jgi:hypothetical protein
VVAIVAVKVARVVRTAVLAGVPIADPAVPDMKGGMKAGRAADVPLKDSPKSRSRS